MNNYISLKPLYDFIEKEKDTQTAKMLHGETSEGKKLKEEITKICKNIPESQGFSSLLKLTGDNNYKITSLHSTTNAEYPTLKEQIIRYLHTGRLFLWLKYIPEPKLRDIHKKYYDTIGAPGHFDRCARNNNAEFFIWCVTVNKSTSDLNLIKRYLQEWFNGEDTSEVTKDNPLVRRDAELIYNNLKETIRLLQSGPSMLTSNNSISMNTLTFPLNTILYGPPGTGKTYNTILRAAQIIENKNITNYVEAQEIFNKNLSDRIEFITFHQNYSYEEFIQGLRPDTECDEHLRFKKHDGIFKCIADRALKNLTDSQNPQNVKRSFEDVFKEFIAPLNDNNEIEVPMKRVSYFITGTTEKSIEFRKNEGDSSHTLSIETLKKMYESGKNEFITGGLQQYYDPLLKILLEKGKQTQQNVEKQNYVLIIDEINRANISRVFGELITLIEPDKRSHGTIPMKCKLPSGDDFIVPSNLYIVGTMNTADKSIALLDIALRRRFEFEPMYPKYVIEGVTIHEIDVLKRLNEEIVQSKGHDFQIGHSYFMGENFDLKTQMNKKVIPLLLEYFMNDKNEVTRILDKSGLIVNTSWPLEISGKK